LALIVISRQRSNCGRYRGYNGHDLRVEAIAAIEPDGHRAANGRLT
jgi:hypothetical protein